MASCWLRGVVLGVVVVAVLVGFCGGRYIITIPKEWVSGGMAQVCVDVDDLAAPAGYLTISANQSYYYGKNPEGRITLKNITISVPAGSVYFCEDIEVPHKSLYTSKLWVRGQVAGDFLNRTMRISFKGRNRKTFIQTDKFLYQPNQEVKIRLLTMHPNNLTVSTDQYPMVYVTTPSGTRIAQWTDVNNAAGLVHLEMTLADEPEQGRYKIRVKGLDGNTHVNYFEVKEYTVPRFEVTITAPKNFLPSHKSFTMKLCAKYTYGQPVRGNFTVEVNNQCSDECWASKNITGEVFGCKNFDVWSTDMRVIDCLVDTLGVQVDVSEAGTGVMQTGKADISISRQAVTFKKIYQDTVKRQGLPYTLKVKVDNPDGTPAVGVPVELCKGDLCSNLTVPHDGMIITAAGGDEISNIRMKALNSRVMLRESTFQTKVKRYYSPSNSAVLIYTPDQKLKCSEGTRGFEYLLPVFFVSDQPKAAFTVQVISKYYIQYYTKTQEFDLTTAELPIRTEEQVEPLEDPPAGTVRGVIYIPITFNNSISPSAKVIVWMVRRDDEVVSDAKELEMERCLPNEAELVWSEAVAEPGQGLEMLVKSAPNSICSLGVVDKGTMLQDTRSNSLTLENIFRPMEYNRLGHWFEPNYNDRQYCKDKLGHNDDDFGRYFTRYYDALGMITGSGLHVLSDLVLETRPCEKSPRVRSMYYYPDGMNYNSVRKTVAYSGASIPERHSSTENEGRTRSFFPETWLWDLYVLPTSGVYSDRVTLPDSITEWVGQAVCVHPQTGLGLSKLTNITTFTPFFIELTLPPSIKRGETLGVLISISNYLKTSLPVKIQVHPSFEYEIVKDPTSQREEGVLEACVEGNNKVVLEVKIKPTALGEVNITVGASVDQRADNECGISPVDVDVSRRDRLVKPITVKPEGFLREKTWNKYICVEDLADGTDSLGRWAVEAPEGIVEGSDRGWVTVVGSLLSISLDNLGHLIRMPYGCGEQNMINFAPNVFILQYLTNTRQDTPEIVTRLTSLMNTGYQRQLLYLRSNGSYSAFGNADPSGSTWLTAFVLKSLAQAQPFITIDSDSLNQSMEWLNGTQAADGCFNSIGQVFNKALKGGSEGRGREALTAYVLISLIEAGQDSTVVVLSGATCLATYTPASQHPYTLALKSYALALARMPEAEETLQGLMTQAVVTSNSTYWEQPQSHSKSLSVETAGYAILAMMTLDAQRYEGQVRKVVKWITAQRNGQGGFYSTQDTVVALQALAKYESTQYQGEVDFIATIKGKDISHSFSINENNKLVTQRASLLSLPTSLSLSMVGGGCAVFQSVLRYNVYEPDSSDTFRLTIKTHTAADRTCTTKWINTCAKYYPTSGKSNMAVITLDLVSGYIPLKDDLKDIVKNSPGVVKRYEVDGSEVSFYIEEFAGGQEVCLRMRVVRVVNVDGAKPGSVTVYDYYQPELSVSKIYTLPSNDECIYTT